MKLSMFLFGQTEVWNFWFQSQSSQKGRIHKTIIFFPSDRISKITVDLVQILIEKLQGFYINRTLTDGHPNAIQHCSEYCLGQLLREKCKKPWMYSWWTTTCTK